jgi:DNA mismatch repair protein MutS
MSLVCKGNEAGICYFDISTLEFNAMKLELHNLLSEIIRINPKEILVSQNLPEEVRAVLEPYRLRIVFQVESYFAENKCARSIQNYYNIASIKPLGEICSLNISSIGAILQYIELTQKSSLPKLSFPKVLNG